MKRFRTCSLEQPLLLAPALQDWLPEDHLARFIAQVVEVLELSEILAQHVRRDGRGKAAYHPVMLVRLLVYGYAVGVRSSRRIEKATFEDVAFRYLAADQHPDHDVIAEFRRVHLEPLSKLFLQVLQLCQRAGLVKLGQVAIDGSKIAANASRQQSRKYERLQEKEAALEAEVKRLLEEAAQMDAQEDARYGKGQRGEELPAGLKTAQQQLKKIQAAKKELEREPKDGRRKQSGRERHRTASRKTGRKECVGLEPSRAFLREPGRGI